MARSIPSPAPPPPMRSATAMPGPTTAARHLGQRERHRRFGRASEHREQQLGRLRICEPGGQRLYPGRDNRQASNGGGTESASGSSGAGTGAENDRGNRGLRRLGLAATSPLSRSGWPSDIPGFPPDQIGKICSKPATMPLILPVPVCRYPLGALSHDQDLGCVKTLEVVDS